MSKKDNISLQWFKDTIEKSVDKAFEKHIILPTAKKVEVNEPVVVSPNEKLYDRLKLIGDVLTVVLKNGKILSKANATPDDFKAIVESKTEQELLDVIATEEVKRQRAQDEREVAKFKIFKNNLKRLEQTGDFKVKGKSVYLKGTQRSLPKLLVEKFAEVISKYDKSTKFGLKENLLRDDEYQGLKRFFMWCCLNPRAEVADDLYDFLERNSFRITKQGFFVALRNVVTVNNSERNELVSFVSQAYNKIKAVWKKNPKDYLVIEHNHSLSLYKNSDTTSYVGTSLGNLQDLYLDLPNFTENRFTDAHTRTFDIRVGQVVNMPMEDCNWNRADCGHAGLHFTSDEIHYVGCGDTSVLILINPMKVVGIGTHKGRCYEYLPIMTVPREEATQILHDGEFDTYQLDELYAIHELESLEEKVKDGFTKETGKHEFNLPAISLKEINKIIVSLNEMGDAIKNRVQVTEVK